MYYFMLFGLMLGCCLIGLGCGVLLGKLAQLEIAIKALEEIRNTQGKVCEIYEICEHVSCSSSYASWAIADEALRHLTPRAGDLATSCAGDDKCQASIHSIHCPRYAPPSA